MKNLIRTAALAAAIFAATGAAAQKQDVDARVNELLARMTLEEKLGQLSQFVTDQDDWKNALANGQAGSILHGGPAADINAIQRQIIANSRLKIPLLIGHDVIHGYRTIFPIPLAMAASWDPAMVEQSARIAATEARAGGVHWTFAPMVDIARDARWGRIAEGAGEDPFLGSAMAEAMVRGFQGNRLDAADSVLACAKHFAAYGAAEGGRDYASAEMSERMLREVYLPPFQAAVKAGVGTLMSAFESLNGVPATANSYLLDGILRQEWKFNGFVVSDWDAVAELINHGVAGSKQEAAIKAITAGVDLDMWDNSYSTLAVAVREGRLPQSVVDTAVRRVLRAKFLLGIMDQPYTDEKRAPSVTLTPQHRAAARRAAQRSIVLLRNEGNLLPLSRSGRTIAVIGPLAEAREDMLGSWASMGKAEETTSVLDGIRAAIPERDRVRHAIGTGVLEGTDADMNAALTLARSSDVVLAVLGEKRDMSGEAASRASLDLPGRQQELLEKLVATGKPVVLLVMSGRPLAISWAAERVPAILYGWFLGTEGGHAIADVLFGDVAPTAKLPVTIPRATGQAPIYYAQLPTGRPPDPAEKYNSKYIDVPIGPLYPFGFGLSYTTVEYSDLRLSAPAIGAGGTLVVSAAVRNRGNRAVEEIVQLYVGDPVASISRPVRELKGFQRVALAAGETVRVQFNIGVRELEFWLNGRWAAEPGQFRVWIAPDSAGGLQGTFELR